MLIPLQMQASERNFWVPQQGQICINMHMVSPRPPSNSLACNLTSSLLPPSHPKALSAVGEGILWLLYFPVKCKREEETSENGIITSPYLFYKTFSALRFFSQKNVTYMLFFKMGKYYF